MDYYKIKKSFFLDSRKLCLKEIINKIDFSFSINKIIIKKNTMGRWSNYLIHYASGECANAEYKFHFGVQAGCDLLCMGGVHWSCADYNSVEYICGNEDYDPDNLTEEQKKEVDAFVENADNLDYADFNIDMDKVYLDCFEKSQMWQDHFKDFMKRLNMIEREVLEGECIVELYYKYYATGGLGFLCLDLIRKSFADKVYDWPEVTYDPPVLAPDFDAESHVARMGVPELKALGDLYTIMRAYKEIGATEICGGFECH